MFCPASYALSQATSTFAIAAQQPREDISKKRKPRGDVVVLVHGLAVNEYSMAKLARRLHKRGFHVEKWSYPSITRGIDENGEDLADYLVQLSCRKRVARLHVVTHSMGGIVARCALLCERPEKLHRLVMLAPPNQGAVFSLPVASLGGIVATPVRQLAPTMNSFVNSLETDLPAEVGILAGDRDVIVRPEETYLNERAEYQIVAGGHASVLTDRYVAKRVARFLRTGTFSRLDTAATSA